MYCFAVGNKMESLSEFILIRISIELENTLDISDFISLLGYCINLIITGYKALTWSKEYNSGKKNKNEFNVSIKVVNSSVSDVWIDFFFLVFIYNKYF